MEVVLRSSPEALLLRLGEFVAVRDLAALRACSGACLEAASNESVWRYAVCVKFWRGDAASLRSAAEALALSNRDAPLCPDENGRLAACESWRRAAERWATLAGIVEDDEALLDAVTWAKVSLAWRLLEERLAARDSEASRAILRSLRPPAKRDDLRRVRARSLRYAYSIHDGQALPFDEARDRRWNVGIRRSKRSIFHGLFGGFSAYDYVVVGRFAPSARVVLVPPSSSSPHHQTPPPQHEYPSSSSSSSSSEDEEEEEEPETVPFDGEDEDLVGGGPLHEAEDDEEEEEVPRRPRRRRKNKVVALTKSEESMDVTFAWSFRENRRFAVSAADDEVRVFNAVPAEEATSELAAPAGSCFGDWFLEYARRVSSGYYDFGLSFRTTPRPSRLSSSRTPSTTAASVPTPRRTASK